MKKIGGALTILSICVLAGCSEQESINDNTEVSYFLENEEDIISKENELINNRLSDRDDSNDMFLRMIKAAGGVDKYHEILETSDQAFIDLFHKEHGVGFKSYENNPENIDMIQSRALNQCVEFLPLVDRNKTHYVNSHSVYIDSSGRPSYARLNFGSYNKKPSTSERNWCTTKVGNYGLSSDHGGHLIAASMDGYPLRGNLAPQNGTLNNSSWKVMENVTKKCITGPARGKYEVWLDYPSNSTVRPSKWNSGITLYSPGTWNKSSNAGFHLKNRSPTWTDKMGVLFTINRLLFSCDRGY